MDEVFRAALSAIGRREESALATVLNKLGSAPRTAGARMLVHADGAIVGSVGGGLVEAEVIRLSKASIAAHVPSVVSFDLRGDLGQGLDMICGGSLEVLLQPLAPTDNHLASLFSLLDTLEQKRTRTWLLTFWKPGSIPSSFGRFVVSQDRIHGDPPESLGPAISTARNMRLPGVVQCDDWRVLVEPFSTNGSVWLFGGGHIALHLSVLCHNVGFCVHVFDDRAEFANQKRFPLARIVETRSFDTVLEGRSLGNDDYVVVVTRGHAHDATVLLQALQTPAGYVGMIGSTRKRDMTYEILARDHGITREQLLRVHCPIGLPIGAQTPQEIAVSIVAELIQHRSSQGG